MLVSSQRLSIVGIQGKDIKPEALMGVTVIGKEAVLTNISLTNHGEGSIPIPPRHTEPGSPTTQIRSVQYRNGLLITGIDGTFTTPVKAMIVAMGEAMMRNGTTGLIFPLTAYGDAPVRKHFGYAAARMRDMDERVNNARLMPDGNGIVFSQGQAVRYLPLHCLNDDWMEESAIIHVAPEGIHFLGRVENHRVPVTLTSGESYFLRVQHGTATPEPILTKTFTKVFGTSGQHLVALRGNELVFARQ